MSSDDDLVEIPGRRNRSASKQVQPSNLAVTDDIQPDLGVDDGFSTNSEQISISEEEFIENGSDRDVKGKSVIGMERRRKSAGNAKKKIRYEIHEISDDDDQYIVEKRVWRNKKRNYVSDLSSASDAWSDHEQPEYLSICSEMRLPPKRMYKHVRTRGSNKVHVEKRQASPLRGGGQGKNYQFRSNVQSAIKFIRNLGLQKHHLDAIRSTPFWHVVDACLSPDMEKLCENFYKSDAITNDICKCYAYIDSKKGFQSGRKFRSPSRSDMAIIFGIRDDERPIVLGSGALKCNDFVVHCFPEKVNGCTRRLDKPYIERRLTLRMSQPADKQCCEDVATLPIHKNMHWHMTEFVRRFDSICSYDWSDYLVQSLMDDIHGVKNQKSGCCTVFLLFWLCEISGITQPVPQAKSFPRFLKWDFKV